MKIGTLLFLFALAACALSLSCTAVHTRSSDTMGGTLHASSESIAGGLYVRTDETFTSRDQYRECGTDRRLDEVRRGYIISVDPQGSCYRQTLEPGDPRGAAPVVTVPTYPSYSAGGGTGFATGAPGVWR